MYTNKLKDKIEYFVRSLGQVELAQINYMFRDYDPHIVEGCINRLVVEGRMFKRDTLYTRSEGIIGSDFTQKLITKAAWVLCYYGGRRVIEYYVAQYPFQLFFILEDSKCFDVTAMNVQTAYSISSAAKRAFDMTTPMNVKGQAKDCIKHVAIVLGQGNPKELVSPDFFDYYAEIEDNNVKLVAISPRAMQSSRARKKKKVNTENDESKA